MEIYTLEELPGKNKKVRVTWDTDDWEYDEPSEHHYSMRDRQINGIGEDESEWSMGISIDTEGDNWDIDYPAELVNTKSSNIKNKLRIVNNGRHYVDRYWDENGRLVIPRDSFDTVSVKEYFNRVLGDYPNIDPKKGPLWIERTEMRKKPEVMLMSVMNQIPSDKIDTVKDPKTEFIRVPEIIDGEEKIVTVPTNRGLMINLLKANNSTWQNQIRPSEINHSDLNVLTRRIINFLF